ncbi:hypothetical protein [Muricoccus pecuniae]|uniref:Uncharacterized protein n=1 Tax=Muricoccus pecuniae TaxID=693023 RepID=A0A840YJ34_9PROT|nr:hypothetical protein [Roseomonas pecuniae]MBB5694672.1 hypothetical protein [Roseomonas pecuniae]
MNASTASPRRRALALALGLLLSCPFPAAAGPQREPGGRAAAEQLAQCADAGREEGQGLRLLFSGLPSFAREVLARHGVRASIDSRGGGLRIELQLESLRDVDLPGEHPATIPLPPHEARNVRQDPRSGIAPLWMLDEATVAAADRAYDIRHDAAEAEASLPARLVHSETAEALPGYEIVGAYTDAFTGFAALVLESRQAPPHGAHRIYAVAGTHVFAHLDFRSWASGLTRGRAQFASTAALRMIRDAAAYARDPRGGEVVLTGQSQGGLTAQGLGYLLQTFLDAEPAPHRLVHVVSWGAAGAEEVMQRLLERRRAGKGRGFGAELEAHWAATDPGYAEAAEVWAVLGRQWDRAPPGEELALLRATAARMRIVGYFFDIDLFARAGTFPGTAMAFPTALILPDTCETTVAEAVFGLQGGAFGVRLESHFLQGYRRAVARGAIALAHPVRPVKWEWVDEVAPAFDALGSLWLETLYFDGIAAGEANWRRCLASGRWQTGANRSCRESFFQGCSPEEEGARRWCLVREGAGGGAQPIIR